MRLLLVCGVPQTTTSNTRSFSKRLPTSVPERSVAAARRTSPGLSPYLSASSRLTWTLIVGSATCRVTRARVTPSIRAIADASLVGDCARAPAIPRRRPGRRWRCSCAPVRFSLTFSVENASTWLAEPGISAHHVPDRGERLAVVRVGADRDPQLARVDTDDLIGGHGPADVAADLGHARQRPQLPGSARREAIHLGQGRARRGIPAHEDLALLERRQGRVSHRGERDAAGHEHETGRQQQWQRARDHARKRRAVARAAAGARAETRPADRSARQQQDGQRRHDGDRDDERRQQREQVGGGGLREERARDLLEEVDRARLPRRPRGSRRRSRCARRAMRG